MIDFSSKKIRIAIAILIVGLFTFVIYYSATHGRIVIKNPGDATVSIISLKKDNSASPEDVSNGAVVTAGNYIVKNNQNKLFRLAQVTVPGWFQAAEVTYEDIHSAKTSRIAALTYEHLIPGDNGTYYSFTDLDGYTSGFTTHPAADAFGGKSVDTSLQNDMSAPSTTNDGQLVGLINDTLGRYSFKTNTTESVMNLGNTEDAHAHTGENIDTPTLKRSSDLNSSFMGLYQRSKEKLTIIDGTKVVKETKLTTTNDRSVVFDINNKVQAILQATTISQETDNLEAEDDTVGYSVSVHGTSANATVLDIGRASTVEALAVDPSGEYVAVNKDSHLWVYRVNDGEVVMFNPFTVSTALFWDKTKLFSLSTDTGINVFDTETRQLLPVSVNTGDSLSFSSVVPFGSKLYFTAFNTSQESQLPDGYVIDLNQKDDGVTSALAEKLPFRIDDYDISFLGNTLYVRINYFGDDVNKITSIKAAAQETIRSLVSKDILKKITVVYDK